MKLNLEFNNKDKSPLKKLWVFKIVEKALSESGCDFLKQKNVEISVVTLSEEEITDINRIYRRKNQPTDVLSFAEYKSKAALEKAVEKDIFLGELILCYNDIKDYAQKKRLQEEKEIANVLSHGVLHLLGFRHGKKMFDIQKKIVKQM